MSAVLAENLSRIYTGGNKAVDSILMIPVMASSVMAASSFVGEKEKHTLETLLYSPLSLKQLFQSDLC